MSENSYIISNIERLIEKFQQFESTSSFSLGAIYGVFKQESIRMWCSDLSPRNVLEINTFLPYAQGAFLKKPIRFPFSCPNKVSSCLINCEFNRIEAFYPFFTSENYKTSDSIPTSINATIDKSVNIHGNGNVVSNFNNNTQDKILISIRTPEAPDTIYCGYTEQYEALAVESLNLIFGGIAQAKVKLRIPSRVNCPSTIWGIFLYQLAWNRITGTGIVPNGSTGGNDSFYTLWPVNCNGIETLPLNIETPLPNGQKIYLPEYYQGIIWVIPSAEMCTQIQNCNFSVDNFGKLELPIFEDEDKNKIKKKKREKKEKYRLTFSPPLILYQLHDGTDDTNMDRAFFSFAWSGESVDPPKMELERLGDSSGNKQIFEIVGMRLYAGKVYESEELSIMHLRDDLHYYETEVSFTAKCSSYEIRRFAKDKTCVDIENFKDIDTTIRLFFCWDDRQGSFPDDLKNAKVRLFVKPNIPDSTNHKNDSTRNYYHSRHQSWLTSLRPVNTVFLSIEKAEKIIERILHGEDYRDIGDLRCYYPQNRISNLVSELGNLVGTSIRALEFMKVAGINDTLSRLKPLIEHLPEKYRPLATFGLTADKTVSIPKIALPAPPANNHHDDSETSHDTSEKLSFESKEIPSSTQAAIPKTSNKGDGGRPKSPRTTWIWEQYTDCLYNDNDSEDSVYLQICKRWNELPEKEKRKIDPENPSPYELSTTKEKEKSKDRVRKTIDRIQKSGGQN